MNYKNLKCLIMIMVIACISMLGILWGCEAERNIKVSVIVPVYNRMEYLTECLDSLSKQTLKDMEILLIDDGSEAEFANFLDEYVAQHKQFKVSHEPHRGVGVSRNRGLELAKGKYIGFVDSDDIIHEEFFEELYRVAEKRKTDIAATPNVPLLPEFSSLNTGIDYSKLTEKGYSIYSKMGGGAQWNKIYRADFLRKYQIKSTLYKSTVEDIYFTTLALMYANEVAVAPQAIYYYRIKPPVIGKHNPDFNRIFIFKELLEHLNDNNLSVEDKGIWRKLIYARMIVELINEYNGLQSNENKKSFRLLIFKELGEEVLKAVENQVPAQ